MERNFETHKTCCTVVGLNKETSLTQISYRLEGEREGEREREREREKEREGEKGERETRKREDSGDTKLTFNLILTLLACSGLVVFGMCPGSLSVVR